MNRSITSKLFCNVQINSSIERLDHISHNIDEGEREESEEFVSLLPVTHYTLHITYRYLQKS